MIIHAPSQLFFHNFSLMNLGFVILEYGHDVSSYGCLKNESIHTSSINVKKNKMLDT